MTLKEYISALSTSTGVDANAVSDILEAIPEVIVECGFNKDSIAIPRFGTFFCEKEEDYISIDENTGKRLLNPPCVKLLFRPSVLLRKKVE